MLANHNESESTVHETVSVGLASQDLALCPYVGYVNSIVRLNTSAALMLTEDHLFEYLNVNQNGYSFRSNSIRFSHKLERAAAAGPSETNLYSSFSPRASMIYFNKRLIVFKHDFVWIFSLLNETSLRTEAAGSFRNFFLSRNYLNATGGVHYSPRAKAFYFFLDKHYFEYDIQNRVIKRKPLRHLTSKVKNVIQNHENFESVYIVDTNNFVYYLNLNNNYMESVDRKTAVMKLFDNCYFES